MKIKDINLFRFAPFVLNKEIDLLNVEENSQLTGELASIGAICFCRIN